MSDLLSPILYVVQNEVDAFWCFCGFMELVVRLRAGVGCSPFEGLGAAPHVALPPQHGNFEESQETMKRQLGQLLLLLRVLDPPLCDFLGMSWWVGRDSRATDVANVSGNERPQMVSRTFGSDPNKRHIRPTQNPKLTCKKQGCSLEQNVSKCRCVPAWPQLLPSA